MFHVAFVLLLFGVSVTGQLEPTYPDDAVAFRLCIDEWLDIYGGLSPETPSETCDSNSPFSLNASDCGYTYLRHSFSRLYATFPRDIFYPRIPTPMTPVNSSTGDEVTFVTATREEMDRAVQSIEWFLLCNKPFTVKCGGHSNAGASLSLGRRLLNLRGLSLVEATRWNEDALTNKEWTGSEDIGTSSFSPKDVTHTTSNYLFLKELLPLVPDPRGEELYS
jgi:hypothetical protein